LPKSIPSDPVRSNHHSAVGRNQRGANYVEADDAVSKKEFLKKHRTCRKEARETKHFCDGSSSGAGLKPEAREIWLEARELI